MSVASIESIDPEVEVVMVTEHLLTEKQLRMKLLDFLIVSPPPEPLHWISFQDYVVNRFKSYYPNKIIKDVFHLIDRTITKKRFVSAVINLDSDDEDTPKDAVEANKEPSCQELPEPISGSFRHTSCKENDVEDIFSLSQDDSSFTQEDLDVFKNNPTVRTYSKLFKDIYALLKEIKDSTSCRVCAKLRYRLVKFHEIVGKESEILKKAAQSEQETVDTAERRERRGSVDSRKNSYYRMMGSKFLTEKEADKIREAILKDKLIELSYPDVLTSAEIAQAQSNTPNDVRKKTLRHSGAAKSNNKSKKLRNSEPVDAESGADELREKEPNPEIASPDSTDELPVLVKPRKKGRPPKISVDSEEAPEKKKKKKKKSKTLHE